MARKVALADIIAAVAKAGSLHPGHVTGRSRLPSANLARSVVVRIARREEWHFALIGQALNGRDETTISGVFASTERAIANDDARAAAILGLEAAALAVLAGSAPALPVTMPKSSRTPLGRLAPTGRPRATRHGYINRAGEIILFDGAGDSAVAEPAAHAVLPPVSGRVRASE